MICLGYDETFCLNALEANACGLPILTFCKTNNAYPELYDYINKDFKEMKINSLFNTDNSNLIFDPIDL